MVPASAAAMFAAAKFQSAIRVNDLDESLKKLLAILRAERLKKARRLGVVEFVNQLISEIIK